MNFIILPFCQIIFHRILSIFAIIKFGKKKYFRYNLSFKIHIGNCKSVENCLLCSWLVWFGSAREENTIFGSAYADVVGADLTGTYIELNYYYTKYRFLCFTHYITVKLLQIFGLFKKFIIYFIRSWISTGLLIRGLRCSGQYLQFSSR